MRVNCRHSVCSHLLLNPIVIFFNIYFFFGGGGGLAKIDSIENPLNDIGYFFLTISVDKLFFKAGQTSP